jgi:hypothetical protein
MDGISNRAGFDRARVGPVKTDEGFSSSLATGAAGIEPAPTALCGGVDVPSVIAGTSGARCCEAIDTAMRPTPLTRRTVATAVAIKPPRLLLLPELLANMMRRLKPEPSFDVSSQEPVLPQP